MKERILSTAMFLLTLIGCSAQSNNKNKIQQESVEYPMEIRKLGIQELYDKCKWHIYSKFADKKLIFLNYTKINDKNTTYGVLPLKFDNVIIKNDTVEINCSFYYKDSVVDGLLVENPPAWGCVFIGSAKKLVLITSKEEYRYTGIYCPDIKDCPDLFAKPLSPEFTSYVNKNANIIDPWLRKEAIKRGVIKE